MIRGLALALLLSVGAADRMPTMDFSVKHSKIGQKPSFKAVTGQCAVASQVTDGVSVGATVGLGGDNDERLKDIFATIKNEVLGRKVTTGLALGLADKGLTGSVEVAPAEGDGPTYTANIDSKNAKVVESVRIERRGSGWAVAPTIHTNNFEVDLEAGTTLGDKTKALFGVKHGGKGKIDVRHEIDDATAIQVVASSGLEDLTVAVARGVGDSDTLRPKFDLVARQLALEWEHRFGENRVIAGVRQADQRVDLEVGGQGEGAWRTKLSAPWTNPRDLDVAVGRKFSLGGLKDFKVGPFGGSD